jgi:hypothetical protein
MRFLWTYLLGILLAALPRRWRRSLGASAVNWARAGVVSGILESMAAIVALGYWYMFEMGRIVSAGIDAATSGKLGPGVTDQQISALALTVLITHPLTWFLGCCAVEGVVRLCAAAFTESVFGILPLALLDWSVALVSNRKNTKAVLRDNTSSFVASVRERILTASHDALPDELRFSRDGDAETLEICASRRKEEWIAAKVVDENYYRLESCSVVNDARPFRYHLGKLAAGVPGRSVILYKTDTAVVHEPVTVRK